MPRASWPARAKRKAQTMPICPGLRHGPVAGRSCRVLAAGSTGHTAGRRYLGTALLRDYFPKGSDLRAVTPGDLARVADEVSNRPRKTLGWARPADLLAGEAVTASA
jgi:hypothetical protein